MNWFFIALLGPIIYALANHTDKYLLSKYVKGGEVGALIIFSSVFSIFVLPILIYFHPEVLHTSFMHGSILLGNGILVMFAVLLYFYALYEDDASVVVSFYQTIPVFAAILGYFFLGETVTLQQGIASLIIILGAFILSFEMGIGKVRFKTKVVCMMLCASLLYAINAVVFKHVAMNEGFWSGTFWGLVGKVCIGFGFLLFIPTYRNQFLTMFRQNTLAVLGLNSLSEILFILGEAVTAYATLLAPVFLVLLVNGFQPLFVFVIGIFLTLFFPKLGKESLSKKIIIQKIIGITLLMVGTYFIGI